MQKKKNYKAGGGEERIGLFFFTNHQLNSLK